MILKRGQDSINIEGGIGYMDSFYIDERRTNPQRTAIHYRVPLVDMEYFMEEKEMEKNLKEGMPKYATITSDRKQILFFPPLNRDIDACVRFYPPMKVM